MAQLDDSLKSILSDSKSLNALLEMLPLLKQSASEAPSSNQSNDSATSTGNDPGAAGSPQSQHTPDAQTAPDDTAQTTQAQEANDPFPPNVEKLAAALPQLIQAFSGSANLVDGQKLNLLKAVSPYLATSRAGSIDRAIRMANMAKATKSAIGIFRG